MKSVIQLSFGKGLFAVAVLLGDSYRSQAIAHESRLLVPLSEADGPPARVSAQPPNSSLRAFKAFIRSSKYPVFVLFSQPGCARCRLVDPVFRQAAQTHPTEANFVKVELGHFAAQEIFNDVGVRTTPTVALYSGGRLVEWGVGQVPNGVAPAVIQNALSKAISARLSR